MTRRHRNTGSGDPAAGPSNVETLRQADLSHLRLQDMTPGQRAELRRRYDDFIRHFGHPAAGPTATAPKGRVKKWMPAAKG